MNYFVKASLLTIAVGMAFVSVNSNATVVAYGAGANAPGRCQAFTPGITNTIRNRVVGSENIGSPIAVACAFETVMSDVSTNAILVDMWFSNNSTAGPVTVNCTMLNGWQGAEGAVAVNKSVQVTNGTQAEIRYEAADTPDTTDTDLGFNIVGVNCTLPTNAVINDTYVWWGDEDGIENPPAP
jgi:hypothetical protein